MKKGLTTIALGWWFLVAWNGQLEKLTFASDDACTIARNEVLDYFGRAGGRKPALVTVCREDAE